MIWVHKKELDADLQVIQLTEVARQLKKLDNNVNGTDTGNDQPMLVLAILEKINMKMVKLFWRTCNDLIKYGKLWRSKYKTNKHTCE